MKDFTNYNQALELKELGFDEPCFLYWYKASNGYILLTEKNQTFQQYILAPTFYQAFRFFREKYKLSGTPQYFTGGYYCYTINDMKDTKESNRLFTEFETHTEAESACLDKLIKIAKSK